MSVNRNAHCVFCGKRRDVYARHHSSHSYAATSLKPSGIDGLESDAEKKKVESKKKPTPYHEGLGLVPETWICGHCRYGPMNINLDTHCQNCHVRRNLYASSGLGIETSLKPGVVDGLKSNAEKMKEKKQGENPPHHWKIESPSSKMNRWVLPANVETDDSLGLDRLIESENLSIANRITGIKLDRTFTGQMYLRSPRAYHKKLKILKDEVYRHSALAVSLRLAEAVEPLSYPLAIKLQIVNWLNTLADDRSFAQSFGQSLGDEPQPAPRIRAIRSVRSNLKACRDIIMAAFSNVWRLQESGFTQNQISILAIDPSRSSVANLLSVPVEDIKALAKMFYCALKVAERPFSMDLETFLGTLTMRCDRLLSSLHLSIRPPETDPIEYYSTDLDCFSIWDETVHLLDLAVLIYAGAHADPLPKEILDIAKPFRPFSSIKLQTRPLKCLSPLLGNRNAWIFSLDIAIPHGEVYISTSLDVFAEIWGPMWKVYSENDRSILQYNVGSGLLVPWEYEAGQHPQLKDDERLGHWMTLSSTVLGSHTNEVVNPWLPTENCSEGDQSEDHDSSESEPEDAAENLDIDPTVSNRWHAYATAHPFSGGERILIGAQTTPKLVWNKCHCSTHRITHLLREKQHLHFLNTSKLFHYVDAKNLSMVAGSHGLTLGANITIKTQHGRSWKEVLLEVWENQPDARHPRTLESFWGVMVSLCTFNARRVRLTELLGTDSIKYLLKPFRWSGDQIKEEFYDAVSSTDPFALRILWERGEK